MRYYYDGWNVVMERRYDGSTESVVNTYVWGADLSGLNGAAASGDALSALHGAGGIGGLLSMMTTRVGSAVAAKYPELLYFYDGNGNVGQLVTYNAGETTDNPPVSIPDFKTGEIAAQYEYDPFGGTLLASDKLKLENPFRFSTKYYDWQLDTAAAGERGLYYYGYRYYSPRLGRWINLDPIGEQGGGNLYSIIANSTPNSIDVLGLSPATTTLPAHKCGYPPYPAVVAPGTPGFTRKEYNANSPWSIWFGWEGVGLRDGDDIYIKPNSKWGKTLRGLITTGLLEGDNDSVLTAHLRSQCDCSVANGTTTELTYSTGPYSRTTTNDPAAAPQIGGLHMTAYYECKMRFCCTACLVSCNIEYEAYDSFHFDINPIDDIKTHFGTIGLNTMHKFIWRVAYDKKRQFTIPCKVQRKGTP